MKALHRTAPVLLVAFASLVVGCGQQLIEFIADAGIPAVEAVDATSGDAGARDATVPDAHRDAPTGDVTVDVHP